MAYLKQFHYNALNKRPTSTFLTVHLLQQQTLKSTDLGRQIDILLVYKVPNFNEPGRLVTLISRSCQFFPLQEHKEKHYTTHMYLFF
jgi:hypothetical protein